MIKLSKSSITTHELIEVTKVLDTSFLGYGEYTCRLESQISQLLNSPCIAVNSGTTALLLALQVANIGPGDHVLLPSLTYVATAQAITAIGAIPCFCDVNLHGHLDIERIPLNFLQLAKAVVPMHYAGFEMDLTLLFTLSRHYGFRVIEDAAHSFGSQNISHQLGDREYDLVCYSFDGIKNITTAEGGAICTASIEDLERLSSISFLGVHSDRQKRLKNKRSWAPTVTEQGWRAHLSNVNAAIGIAQLARREDLWSARIRIANEYQTRLTEYSSFVTCTTPISQKYVPHIFPVKLKNVLLREKLESLFLLSSIEFGRHYYPCHLLSYFRSYPCADLVNTLSLYDTQLSLPLHPEILDRDIRAVVDVFSQLIACE